jgi:hypothetical protein
VTRSSLTARQKKNTEPRIIGENDAAAGKHGMIPTTSIPSAKDMGWKRVRVSGGDSALAS